jgi:dipeptidyl aminopeptidase/acylaminoacyl peptidase
MAKRGFRAEDFYRLKTAADPAISADGKRVAWVQFEVDQEADRLRSCIMVADFDGGSGARRFSEGPADSSPRWSPDGRFLAYVSAPAGASHRAHLRLAPLAGGAPLPLGDLPGPVSQPAWSPDGTRLAVVVRTGVEDPESRSAAQRNEPRLVRGLAARLDGVGWKEGRRHVFVVDVADGSARQITKGDYDHDDPAWSPDGQLIAVSSNRDRDRDDAQFRSDIWVIPAAGGRPRRLTPGGGRVSWPQFSPDGSRIAFAGHLEDSWAKDSRVFVMPLDGSAAPETLSPATDRGLIIQPGAAAPFRWTGVNEIALLLTDHGSTTLHLGTVGKRASREVVGGDTQIDGLAIAPNGRAAAFTAAWPHQPSEVYGVNLRDGEVRRLSGANDDLLAEVELSPVMRHRIRRPDGTEIEYFTIAPAGARNRNGRAKRPPIHLDIHGGPHGVWPASRFLGFHQTLAAAGYLVVLPNPRGSTSYGQAFTEACTYDWGGADYEDILACCDDVIERGAGDGERMFVSGGSYGGFMTTWIVGHTHRFRAASPMAAVVDQAALALTTEIPYFSRFNMGDTPWERPDEYRKRSPLTYLPDVRTPVQVIHWEGDLRVPISQSEELYTGLKLLGKEVELVRYPGGFHIMRSPSQAVDWAHRILDWNKRHDP